MRLRLAALALGLIALAGCRGDPIAGANNPEQLTMYSLDGLRHGEDKPSWTGEVFRHTQVLGKVEVTDPDKRRELVAALKSGVFVSKSTTPCFWPRHGIRVTEGGRTVDFLICFQCKNMKTYQGDSITDSAFCGDAEPAFNAVLTDAGIPLAP